MDDVDINLFQFDPDLTMHMFFLNGGGFVYSRYGIRKNGDSESVMSVAGIRDAIKKVLDIHKRDASRRPAPWKPFDTQDLLSFKKDPRRPGGCLHCHHAGYYLRKEEFMVGWLSKDRIWGFPLPDNIGLALDTDRNTLVKEATGLAAKAGVRSGDRVVSVDGRRVVTPADVTWVLNGFKGGTLRVGIDREGKTQTLSMELRGDDWRKTDISWRQSWWDSGPEIGLKGTDAGAEERKRLGLASDAIAIRVTEAPLGGSAASSGIRKDDLIVGVDGLTRDLEPIELLMYVRLKFKAGDTAPLVLLRGGRRMPVAVKLK